MKKIQQKSNPKPYFESNLTKGFQYKMFDIQKHKYSDSRRDEQQLMDQLWFILGTKAFTNMKLQELGGKC